MATESTTFLLPVENMDSEHCALIVDKAVGTVPEVAEHHMELNNRRAVIRVGSHSCQSRIPIW